MPRGSKRREGVRLERLQVLPSAEEDLYRRLFKEAGGRGRHSISGSAGAAFLQRSGLPEDVLRAIWHLADDMGAGSLDLESFSIACRLVAHAQEHGHQGVLPEAIRQVPSQAPWFEEAGPESAGFDFEAVALGVDGPAGEPSGAPIPSSTDDRFDWPSSDKPSGKAEEFGGSAGSWAPAENGHLGRDRYSTRYGISDDVGRPSGSAVLLMSELEAVHSTGTSASLEKELAHERKDLDEGLAKKAVLEEHVRQLSARLEACCERRHGPRLQLSVASAETERLFAGLDFTRQQIEDIERIVARLREARGAYSKAELQKVQSMSSAALPIRSSQIPLAELRERARRTGRQKSDLQAKQQLMLANQRQAEQDRNYAQKALQESRQKLLRIQAERLRLQEERLNALKEAEELATSAGLGKNGLKELLRQCRPEGPVEEFDMRREGLDGAQDDWPKQPPRRPWKEETEAGAWIKQMQSPLEKLASEAAAREAEGGAWTSFNARDDGGEAEVNQYFAVATRRPG